MLKLTFAQNTRFVKCNETDQIFASLEISPDQSTQFIQKTSHVALAIDCSGSMAGEKLEDAKISAIEAVKSLTENDLVSIVAFGTDVNVELSARSATDPSVVDRINTLDIMGFTDLHGGISEAFAAK